MKNSFSQIFTMDEQVEKKFYFVPNNPTNTPTRYNMHINGDAEIKKFELENPTGDWKIKVQEVNLPKWLFTLEGQFDQSIKEHIAQQSK